MTEAYDSKEKLIVQMGEIGEVMHLAKSGRLIVKLNAAGATGIRPGEVLIDSAGRRVGRISELIGPVNAPYASVIPMTDRTARLTGAKVFAGGRPQQQTKTRPSSHGHKQHDKERRRGRRN
ncbi:RNA-binding protein involved in rRNA processing [Candidatus Nitrososphaera evergladensis SR1]|uniref:RNA-binding protein involved in rRNA processing n=2 Tax=Nitrososphaera TaxID=497726 RepID=A0A075MRD0_9ARCH|nr:RNA-binding protein involved in rRNA processing [Candidatus Nitrososphaera evergladensis SR1]